MSTTESTKAGERAQHTPGPWILTTVKTSIGACHRIGLFPGPTHKPDNYACVYADGEYPDNSHLTARGKELLANARLIAKAPEMLAHIRKAVAPEAFETWGMDDWEEWDNEAVKLIAEVEGREDVDSGSQGRSTERRAKSLEEREPL